MLTVEMLIQLHSKSKEPINLVYTRPSGRKGYCYLDPSTPLMFKNTEKGWQKAVATYTGYEKVDFENAYYSFVKHDTKSVVYVQLKNVEIHSKQKQMVMGILYGSK